MNSRSCISAVGIILILSLLLGCGAPGIKTAPTPEGQFVIAKKAYDKKHYLTAIEGFQKVIFNFPGALVVDSAQYYLAMSYFDNGEHELAAVEFDRLISNYPRSSFVDDSKYMAGVCFFRSTPKNYSLDQEELLQAISAMEDFLIENPDSPRAPEARRIILQARTRLAHKEYDGGMLYYRLSNYEAARIYFQLVIDEYTDTEYGARAMFKLSEIAYKQGKYSEAAEKFANFIAVYPKDNLVPQAKKYIEKISPKLDTANVSGVTK